MLVDECPSPGPLRVFYPGSWRPKSSQSDLTMSSSDGSPVRRPRPHSIAGRLPNYATPTVSFQVRTSRSTEKKSAGNLTVCYRFRKLSLCFYYHFLYPPTPTLPHSLKKILHISVYIAALSSTLPLTLSFSPSLSSLFPTAYLAF